MDQQEQSNLVEELFDSVKAELLQKIASGKVPKHWTGHELRKWSVDKFQEQGQWLNMRRKQAMAYKNDVIANGL